MLGYVDSHLGSHCPTLAGRVGVFSCPPFSAICGLWLHCQLVRLTESKPTCIDPREGTQWQLNKLCEAFPGWG